MPSQANHHDSPCVEEREDYRSEAEKGQRTTETKSENESEPQTHLGPGAFGCGCAELIAGRPLGRTLCAVGSALDTTPIFKERAARLGSGGCRILALGEEASGAARARRRGSGAESGCGRSGGAGILGNWRLGRLLDLVLLIHVMILNVSERFLILGRNENLGRLSALEQAAGLDGRPSEGTAEMSLQCRLLVKAVVVIGELAEHLLATAKSHNHSVLTLKSFIHVLSAFSGYGHLALASAKARLGLCLRVGAVEGVLDAVVDLGHAVVRVGEDLDIVLDSLGGEALQRHARVLFRCTLLPGCRRSVVVNKQVAGHSLDTRGLRLGRCLPRGLHRRGQHAGATVKGCRSRFVLLLLVVAVGVSNAP
ncbi:hypothetical protein BN1708_010301 [Verticillium longisporum]|uniref:Uncharacterized protein n=1 Tax=Verticillium longisporum TaxID=100787 RepID=A0A0G4KPT6_VERLO|nr:hypothetical protein BN1708_010301 [Verticillium longisporum]